MSLATELQSLADEIAAKNRAFIRAMPRPRVVPVSYPCTEQYSYARNSVMAAHFPEELDAERAARVIADKPAKAEGTPL